MNRFSIKNGCLSGSTLKIIAIIAMAIDHFAASIILYGILMQQNPTFLGHPVSMAIPWWNIYQVMRFIGRIGFPIFCFWSRCHPGKGGRACAADAQSAEERREARREEQLRRRRDTCSTPHLPQATRMFSSPCSWDF